MDKTEFRKELESLINRHSMENNSNTPDFILADYLDGCLQLFDITVERREQWYGRDKNKVHPITGPVGEEIGDIMAREENNG